MLKIILFIIILLAVCYLILHENALKDMENCILKNIIYNKILAGYSFLYFLFSFSFAATYIATVNRLFFFIACVFSMSFLDTGNSGGKDENNKNNNEVNNEKNNEDKSDNNKKLTDRELEFQKEKEELERRKIQHETDYVSSFKSILKICIFLLALIAFFMLIGYLLIRFNILDFFIEKINKQFIYLNEKLFFRKKIKFFIIADWNIKLVNEYEILKNEKFEKQEIFFFVTDFYFNWMLERDTKLRKSLFKRYNLVFYKNKIIIFEEKKVKKDIFFITSYKKRLFLKIVFKWVMKFLRIW